MQGNESYNNILKCMADLYRCLQENKAQNCVRNDSMQSSLNRLQQDPTLFATPGQASAARRALSSSRKYNYVCEQNQANSVLHPKKEFSAKPTNNLKSHNEYKNLKHVKIKFPGEHQTFSNPVTQTSTELYKCDGLQYADQLMDEGNIRNKEPRTPKSCLLTPGNKDSKRDFGHVTFLSNNTDKTQRWSPRPFLGYDWIAGLLEAESPIANKSEQFYSDINEFRRVNREECVHNYYTDPEAQETSSSEDELDGVIDTHDCVYCYRVNNRLFTSPVGSESACPICKKRRSKRRPTIEEPAYIRVSIPRSTLLPPYKYKAHRRKSFDPTDSLALPSHCLVGWENAVPSCDLNIASLDLKTSVQLGTKAHVSTFENSTMDNTSYYDSRARSENLLNMSRCMFLQSCNKN
ncbi:migration and invasion-inhibitory protein isoform X2 [Xenopus laevis]|uniref:Migration and invasion-inhibitory protein isoform X2 n=1 Tax=Xenopus laevis TaxID=8355 RepID=A0A8J0T8C6_XENLA|nr:migration and invasion-inhibitory protein isoform X2 [Xenopus laevis]